jgi:hypothetical protein
MAVARGHLMEDEGTRSADAAPTRGQIRRTVRCGAPVLSSHIEVPVKRWDRPGDRRSCRKLVTVRSPVQERAAAEAVVWGPVQPARCGQRVVHVLLWAEYATAAPSVPQRQLGWPPRRRHTRSCRGWPRSYRDFSSSARVEAAVPVFSSGSVVVVALCSVSSRSARCGRCSYPECGRCLIRCWISVEQGDARIPVVGDPVDEYSQVLVEQVAWDRLLEQRAERAEHRAVDPVQPRAWVVSAQHRRTCTTGWSCVHGGRRAGASVQAPRLRDRPVDAVDHVQGFGLPLSVTSLGQ